MLQNFVNLSELKESSVEKLNGCTITRYLDARGTEWCYFNKGEERGAVSICHKNEKTNERVSLSISFSAKEIEAVKKEVEHMMKRVEEIA